MSPERKSVSSIVPSLIISALIDTGKLIVGFSEADNVERAVKVEDDKWQVSLKVLQDSLQAQVDRMSKEYDV